MSTRTIYVSDSVYRTIPASLRKDLLAHLSRDAIVGRHASNIESDLRAMGENELAERLLDDLHYLPYPLRVR